MKYVFLLNSPELLKLDFQDLELFQVIKPLVLKNIIIQEVFMDSQIGEKVCIITGIIKKPSSK